MILPSFSLYSMYHDLIKLIIYFTQMIFNKWRFDGEALEDLEQEALHGPRRVLEPELRASEMIQRAFPLARV